MVTGIMIDIGTIERGEMRGDRRVAIICSRPCPEVSDKRLRCFAAAPTIEIDMLAALSA